MTGPIRSYFRPMIFTVIGSLLLTFFWGCGGSGSGDHQVYDPTVKIVDLPPGADPSVPAELGGAGFEEIAADLGFTTYEFTEEDLKYYGDPRAKKGGTYRSWTSRFPATMRTVGQNSNYVENSTFGSMIYQSLLDFHPITLDPVPTGLATHWKISADKRTYWYRINPDARWSDGMRVTAEDVIASWKLRMDPGVLAPSNILTYGKFDPPEAVSPYIVKVHSKVLNWRNFIYFSGMGILPAHKLKELAEKYHTTLDSVGKAYLEEYQFKMLPGTGPYYFRPQDIKKQISYTLTRRKDFWAADAPWNRYRHNFDRIRFIVIKDNERLPFEKFKKGELDAYVVGRDQWWVEECNFDDVKKGYIQKRKIYTQYPVGTMGFALNMREWPFDNHDVRRAFRYLFNVEGMIHDMMYDEPFKLTSFYSHSVYENPHNPRYDYNPEKAVALLQKAGYTKRNEQGILVGPDGRPFILEMGIVKLLEKYVTPFQRELKKVGIDLRLKFQDGNALWKMMMERKFKMAWVNWGGLVFPNPETSLKSDLADKNDTNNLSGVKNAAIDSLFPIYDTTFVQSERVKIIRTIDSLSMCEDHLVMGWGRDYRRILYWNKFGHPDYYLTRYGSAGEILDLWWFDPEQEQRLEAARKNGEAMEVGPLEITTWRYKPEEE